MQNRRLHLDYETKSEVDLKVYGLDVYSSHPSTKVILAAWHWGDGNVQQWEEDDGPFPEELAEALADPTVEKWAFNAQFERVITKRVLKIDTPYQGWRCTMVLAYMQSFTGTLEQVGEQVGLPVEQQKLKVGRQLIQRFCKPRKPTKNDPRRWHNAWTDPQGWETFKEYNRQDVEAETAIYKRLIKFPIQGSEWKLYEIDQETNDRGIPIDMQFVRNAIVMADRRRAEITSELVKLTGLKNPNSPAQLSEWLKARGYPFSDLRADTVKKVLAEHKAEYRIQTEEVVECLKWRQQVARTSVKKYNKLSVQCVDLDGDNDYRFRFGFQFAGASRTNRAAGRGLNPQNLTRTPKEIEPDKSMKELGVEPDFMLTVVTNLIRDGDYDGLALTVKEPMDALAGCTRSAIRAPPGQQLTSCDLSSIESCVIGFVSGCERLLNVFRNGLDPYIDFGTEMYNKKYEDVTKRERQEAKPGVLGAGFRLGGGELREGKRTGLWGYAESMGVDLTQEQATRIVVKFREVYPEIPKLWYALEEAAVKAVRTGLKVAPIIYRSDGKKFVVPVVFEMMKPYLTIILPSGRRMYYYKPRVHKEVRISRAGNPYDKLVLSYMGRDQGDAKWRRITTHGGKITENIVQAIARDILMDGYRRAADAGFLICMHVHDELIALAKKGCDRLAYLRELMIKKDSPALAPLPLNAAGSVFDFYRKD